MARVQDARMLSRDRNTHATPMPAKPLFSCGSTQAGSMPPVVFFWSREAHPVLRMHTDLRRSAARNQRLR
jgi:hypothetical protein